MIFAIEYLRKIVFIIFKAKDIPMKYLHAKKATFLRRPNRFIAYVDLDGVETITHVKNTGRCKELLIPGVTVILEESDNPNRKTKYDLVSVYKEALGLINIDSQAPNKIVHEWLLSNKNPFPNITKIKPESNYGNSRFDFYIEYDQKKAFLEVKGVTLEVDGIAYFPDAPTTRGAKHLRELKEAIKDGYETYIAFVIQMPGITEVLPNRVTDPSFADAYEEALASGVKLLTIPCLVEEDAVTYL